MLTPIIAALVVGWLALSCLACVAACMASSRFSAQVEGQEFQRDQSGPVPPRPHLKRQPAGIRLEHSTAPAKIKLG